jgi:glycyl-tRNA synthetase beta chain
MTEFILELFSEEIPSRMQKGAAEKLLDILCYFFLVQKKLSYDSAHVYVTPRRLVAVIKGFPLVQSHHYEEKKGPRLDAPVAAIEGFLKSQHVTREQCEERTIEGKGVFLFAKIHKKGQKIEDILKEAVTHLLETFHWPKKMRWGTGAFEWVRPLKRVSAIFNGDVLSITPPHTSVDVRGYTEGHRFLYPHEFKITIFEAYKGALRKAYVMLDAAERKSKILEDMEALAATHNLMLKTDLALLDEVVGLVEWPKVLMGHIEQRYMQLPPEVLVTTMAHHQRYFPAYTQEGALAPFFFVVSNMETVDDGAAIVRGNERVLSARFSDAAFYWEKDLQTSFDTWNEALKDQVFYAPLGTMQEKVKRLERLATILEPENAFLKKAARYAKADLASGVVGEFPDLQGTMGFYYATARKMPAAIATALKDYYLPKGSFDRLPEEELSLSLALIDRVDTLVSFFSIGVYPTGSKDPYALRRQAVAIIRLLVEKECTLNLFDLFKYAYEGVEAEKDLWDVVLQKLKDFMKDRFESFLVDSNFTEGNALISTRRALPFFDHYGCLYGTTCLAKELKFFLETEAGAKLVEVYKRASNIIEQVERKENRRIPPLGEGSPLQESQEQHLFQAVTEALHKTEEIAGAERFNFKALLEIFASLHHPLEVFFKDITVMDHDAAVRERRLSLLATVRALFTPYVDMDA